MIASSIFLTKFKGLLDEDKKEGCYVIPHDTEINNFKKAFVEDSKLNETFGASMEYWKEDTIGKYIITALETPDSVTTCNPYFQKTHLVGTTFVAEILNWTELKADFSIQHIKIQLVKQNMTEKIH